MKRAHTPLVIGNWKMNPMTQAAAKRLYSDVKKGVARMGNVDVVVAPPALFISELQRIGVSKRLVLGAQNTYWEKLGAHTGELSPVMLKNGGVSYIIVGHSEIRERGETNEEVNKKVHAVLKEGLAVVVCVGEKKRDDHGHYFIHIEKQIRAACAGITKAKLGSMVLAYEPIWAIGTGVTATPEDAHEMKIFVQKILSDMYGRNVAMRMHVLYGGSVSAKNAEELLQDGMVDGFLVGGASLHAEEFVMIAKIASKHGAK